MSLTVLYAAAHGGYADERAPLGGGAAVCDRLAEQWGDTKPFDLVLLGPREVMGASAPRAADLVSLGERGYARFCRVFERAATAAILRHDPASTVVLANDISEGPDFRALHAAGFRVFTIYHVDVVAYISAIYARNLVSPSTLALMHGLVRSAPLPDIVRLVFDKQLASVECSEGLIVPSAAMKETLLASYPGAEAERIHVVPWGCWDHGFDDAAIAAEATALRSEYHIPDGALVLLALSRISPEKGQDLLLKALLYLERSAGLPDRPLFFFVCGGAAFMQGRRFEANLRRIAAQFRRVRIEFPGHVTGLRKQAFFAIADLYTFPSRHESYGLTLLEAMRAGLPAVCLDSAGAREIMQPDFGATVSDPAKLDEALQALLGGDELRAQCAAAAREFALTQRFESAAARIATLLQHGRLPPA